MHNTRGGGGVGCSTLDNRTRIVTPSMDDNLGLL